jgi:hypothetical protein
MRFTRWVLECQPEQLELKVVSGNYACRTFYTLTERFQLWNRIAFLPQRVPVR